MSVPPRLRAVIDASLHYRVTEIVAPAGFGKSTLIDHLAAEHDFLIARVRPSGESALALMEALCEAVAYKAPELRRTLPPAYANASAAKSVSQLAGWFFDCLPIRPCRIAIDDLHYLGDDDTAWELLCELVESSRATSRWVLSARTWLKVPSVDWVASGTQSPSIDQAALKFGADDLTHVAESLGVPISSNIATKIAEATQGWPLLAVYGLRLLPQRIDTDDLTDALKGRGIDAITERLLSGLEDCELRLLLAVGLYDGVHQDLLERTHPGGHRALVKLAAEGVPLTQSYDRRWRLHDLLRTRLFERERTNTLSESKNICAALEAMEHFEEALTVALACNDEDSVRTLVERHVNYFLFAASPQLLQRAIGVLPRQVTEQSANLALARGVLEARLGHPAIGIAYLRRGVELSYGERRSYALTRLGFGLLGWQGHGSEGLDLLREASSETPPEDVHEACEVFGGTAVGLAFSGDIPKALVQIDRAMTLLPRLKAPLIEARLFIRAGQVAFLASMFEQAESYFGRAITTAEQHGFSDVLLMAFDYAKNLSAPHTEAQAIAYAQRAAALAAKSLDQPMLYLENASLFTYACRRGEVLEAQELGRSLFPIPEQRRPRFEAILLIANAHLSMLQNDLEKANGFLKRVHNFGELALNRDIIPLRESVYYSYSALLNQLRSTYDNAVRDAKRSINVAANALLTGMGLSGIPELELAKITASAMLGLNGRISEAQPILDDMAANAHEQYRRDLASWVSELIGDPNAQPSEEARTRANGIIILLQRCAAGVETVSLTPAERRVLEALAEGYPTKEIAAMTGRSVKTVNNQITSILRKLQARSRGEAVARARRRGLLSEKREPASV